MTSPVSPLSFLGENVFFNAIIISVVILITDIIVIMMLLKMLVEFFKNTEVKEKGKQLREVRLVTD